MSHLSAKEIEERTPRVRACIEAVMRRYPSDKSTKYFEAVHQELAPLARELEREVADLRAALEAAKIPPDRLQNWIDVIHDNERSMGDRLQSLSSIFGGLLRGDAVDKYPLQPIREQKPDSERDAARWRAFVGSARIKPQGSAGLENPQEENYAHMGLEIWTTFPHDYSAEILDQIDHATALGRCWLTAYADVAVSAMAARQGEAQPLPGDKPSH